MNENVDLTKILENCPKGTKFYSSIYGDLLYSCMYLSSSTSKITFIKLDSITSVDYCRDGKRYSNQGECTIFPSRDCRDWSKFSAPWYKKEKFDPKILKPFDRVICKNGLDKWHCDFFSSYMHEDICPYVCISGSYMYCIPYNDYTKHLVGTIDEAPDLYRYWEE